MAEHYIVERSKAPMPEWEVLGTYQTFNQARLAEASWRSLYPNSLMRIVRVSREVMGATDGVALPQRPSINWEPLQEFWRANPSIDWDELERAVNAAYGVGTVDGGQRNG